MSMQDLNLLNNDINGTILYLQAAVAQMIDSKNALPVLAVHAHAVADASIIAMQAQLAAWQGLRDAESDAMNVALA